MIATIVLEGLENKRYRTIDEQGNQIAEKDQCEVGTLLKYADSFMLFLKKGYYCTYDERFNKIAEVARAFMGDFIVEYYTSDSKPDPKENFMMFGNSFKFDKCYKFDKFFNEILTSNEQGEQGEQGEQNSRDINCLLEVRNQEERPASSNYKDKEDYVEKIGADGDPAIDLPMVYVKGGAFMMGYTPEPPTKEYYPLKDLTITIGYCGPKNHEAEPVHRVTLSSYHIGKYPVTQAQWKAVMGHGNNPSKFKGDDLPVENVSWYDALEFCDKLSVMTGKNMCCPPRHNGSLQREAESRARAISEENMCCPPRRNGSLRQGAAIRARAINIAAATILMRWRGMTTIALIGMIGIAMYKYTLLV